MQRGVPDVRLCVAFARCCLCASCSLCACCVAAASAHRTPLRLASQKCPAIFRVPNAHAATMTHAATLVAPIYRGLAALPTLRSLSDRLASHAAASTSTSGTVQQQKDSHRTSAAAPYVPATHQQLRSLSSTPHAASAQQEGLFVVPLPKLSHTMTCGRLTKWHKREGDKIQLVRRQPHYPSPSSPGRKVCKHAAQMHLALSCVRRSMMYCLKLRQMSSQRMCSRCVWHKDSASTHHELSSSTSCTLQCMSHASSTEHSSAVRVRPCG